MRLADLECMIRVHTAGCLIQCRSHLVRGAFQMAPAWCSDWHAGSLVDPHCEWVVDITRCFGSLLRLYDRYTVLSLSRRRVWYFHKCLYQGVGCGTCRCCTHAQTPTHPHTHTLKHTHTNTIRQMHVTTNTTKL